MDYTTVRASPAHRILILGGGFAGVFVARRLQKLLRDNPGVQITLVSRDNFLLMTPLMFEACTGTLEPLQCSISIREFLRTTRFIEATVERIDLDRRAIHASAGEGDPYELGYDQLVLALGATTDVSRIPGANFAFTFKTLADVITLRNHLIERFERADIESDSARRERLLTFVVIGGGLVGTEIFGELTHFMDEALVYYPNIRRQEVRLYLLEANAAIMPEVSRDLADYAMSVLRARAGVNIQTQCHVQSIEPGKVHLKDSVIETDTIVLSAGIRPSPIIAKLPLEKDKHGKVIVDATMRHRDRPEIWAIGDCASIPDPQGKPYPSLAQHAMREARVLADNIHAVLNGAPPRPFEYKAVGIMAALGHYKGLGEIFGIKVHGFIGWWIRRTYYLMVVPRWAQRVRIAADWTISMFFRPNISKVDLAEEHALLNRLGAAGTIQNGAADEPQPAKNSDRPGRAEAMHS